MPRPLKRRKTKKVTDQIGVVQSVSRSNSSPRKRKLAWLKRPREPMHFQSSTPDDSSSSDRRSMSQSTVDEDLPDEEFVPYINYEELQERVHMGDGKCAHQIDCYPRTIHLIGLIDMEFKDMLAANILAKGNSHEIEGILANKLGLRPGQVGRKVPLDFEGNIYQWAQDTLKDDTFIVVIFITNDGNTSHAVVLGKIQINDPHPHSEILLIDTQTPLWGDAAKQYVYNLGEANINKYLIDHNFDLSKVARLGLYINLTTLFSRLSLGLGKKLRTRTRRRKFKRRMKSKKLRKRQRKKTRKKRKSRK